MRREINIQTGEIVEDTGFVAPTPDPATLLAAERASMRVTPLQGKLALGEARWARIEALLADPASHCRPSSSRHKQRLRSAFRRVTCARSGAAFLAEQINAWDPNHFKD